MKKAWKLIGLSIFIATFAYFFNLEAGFVIENTKNNISGAAIQCRTSPVPLEESCPRWQEGADTRRVLTSPGWGML